MASRRTAECDEGLPAKRFRHGPDPETHQGQGPCFSDEDSFANESEQSTWTTDPTIVYDASRDSWSQGSYDLAGIFEGFTAPTKGSAPYVSEDQSIVCYGALVNVNARLFRSGPLRIRDISARAIEGYVELSLHFSPTQITVSLPCLDAFAQLNSVATAILNDIFAKFRISIKPYMAEEAFAALTNPRPEVKDSGEDELCFAIDINIFGSSVDGDNVGQILSSQCQFLQEPRWRSSDVPYVNPHVWKFDDISDVDVFIAGLALGKPADEQVSIQQGWNNVLDGLSAFSTGYLDLDVSLLKTELLGHQNDALGFMTRRENGQLSDEMRYWKSGTGEHDDLVYRHVVTQTERRDSPEEPAGGILADDMGLGKTLSAIALIITSLPRAEAFSKQSLEQASHGTLAPTRATLVVVPSLLILEEWQKEIEKRAIPEALRVVKYHGHERVSHFSAFLSVDIVLTTYGTIATEHRRRYKNGRGREVLYFLRWFRIVLDEAHTIRSARTTQCKSVLELHAKHHWCLTGTPVSNKVDDLAPLLRFCHVPLLEDAAIFRDHVTKITRKSIRQGCKALHQVLSPVCLRRTKALLDLPLPQSVEYCVDFSAAEDREYKAMLRESRNRFNAHVSGQTEGKKKHTILQAILQLRMFCDRGTFMRPAENIHDMGAQLDPDEELTLFQEEDLDSCAHCSSEVAVINQPQDMTSGLLGSCSHIICAACLGTDDTHRELNDTYHCLACEQQVTEKMLHQERETGRREPETHAYRSAKLEQLVQDLLSTGNNEKSIVFSVWKKTLDIGAHLCDAAGIRYVRIDGTVAQAQRHEALEEFKSTPEVLVLLMTLGTGALGLNLTIATRVHILEPQWNPAVESQAIGRVIRLGQEKRTTIVRYTIKQSVEQQIQTYQRRKMQLAAGGFGDGANQHEIEAKILTATFFTGGKL